MEEKTLLELEVERKALNSQRKKLDKLIKAATEKELKLQFKGIFEQCPSVQSFAWQQYTDYWNDGDTCHFHVHYDTELITVNGKSELDDEELTTEELKAQEMVSKIIKEYDSDDMQLMFGDHTEVRVTKEKIETCECVDHD